MISVSAEKCPLFPPPSRLSFSPSLFSYSLNSCCVSLFVIFVLFFHLAPCDKIFACLRTSWPSCFPGFSFPSSLHALPLSHLVSQLVNKRLPLGTTATRRVRAQARSQAGPPCLLSLAALLLCCTRNLALSGAAIPNSRCCANFVMRLQIFNNCPDL